jgi:hypothetical protein
MFGLSSEQLALLLSALGIGAVLRDVARSLLDRRKVGADTTSVLTSVALTLVKPLNEQLEAERAVRATEHAQHIADLRAERAQASALRDDLDKALTECRDLRDELEAAHKELTRLRARLDDAGDGVPSTS